jgi:hypothetical protein
VLENRVLGRIFFLRRDMVTGEWRKLHKEELCDLYSLPRIIINLRRVRWAGQERNVYRLMVGKPERRRPSCRWVDNIKVDLGESMGWCGLDWSGSG